MKSKDVSRMLSKEGEQLQKLQQIVKETIAAEALIVQNLLNPPLEQLTVGQKIPEGCKLWRQLEIYNHFRRNIICVDSF